MAINLNLNSSNNEAATNLVCHRLPCRIDYRGVSNVSKYFTPNIRVKDDDSNILTCSFRGRPLVGKGMPVPEEYVGVVFEEKPSLSKSVDVRDLNAIGSFESFTSWNWDQVPTNEDKLSKAFDWIDLSAAIHQPVYISSSDNEEKETTKDQEKHHKRKRHTRGSD